MSEASSPPTATVIVPTFRRPDGLRRLLGCLARQQAPGIAWDILVIDNDDGVQARRVFDAWSPSLPVPARFVHEAARGSAHARNRGIADAGGGIIVMVDDDVRPADDWLATLLEPVLAGRCDGVGGRVLLDPTVAPPRWFAVDALGGYLAHWDPASEERPLEPDETVVTSNCAFRADLLRRTKGFDPALGPRNGTPLVNDDRLLTRRFVAVGGRVRFVPQAVVIHDLPRERLRIRYLVKRAYAHGRSDWILDRQVMTSGRARGAGAALRTLGQHLRHRAGEGIGRPHVAVRALCDVARAAGSLREAAAAIVNGRR